MQGLPDPVAGVRWRRATDQDGDPFFALIRRIDAVDDPTHPLPRGEFDAMLAGSEPAADLVLGEDGGVPVAFAWRRRPGGGPVRLIGGVEPGLRGRGAGRALLSWQLAEARRRDADAGTATVRQAARSDVAGIARRAGFAPERVFLTLRRPAGGAPVAEPPVGLRSVPLHPALDDAVRTAKNDAFRDHWRPAPSTPEEWRLGPLGPQLRRDLSRILVAPGGEVAAFVLLHEVDGPRGGGHVPLVGTRRPWRGRGAARALLAEVVGACAAAGLGDVDLDVDASSPTGADRLYASVGFTETSRATIWSRSLR